MEEKKDIQSLSGWPRHAFMPLKHPVGTCPSSNGTKWEQCGNRGMCCEGLLYPKTALYIVGSGGRCARPGKGSE